MNTEGALSHKRVLLTDDVQENLCCSRRIICAGAMKAMVFVAIKIETKCITINVADVKLFLTNFSQQTYFYFNGILAD